MLYDFAELTVPCFCPPPLREGRRVGVLVRSGRLSPPEWRLWNGLFRTAEEGVGWLEVRWYIE